MALFGPLAMHAQSTYSWGSSSDYSNYSNYANPFGRYYGYEYRVYLYPPNTMPFSGNITQVEFLPKQTMSSNGGQMTVWMKTVTDITALSSSTTFATYMSGATQVYNTSSSPSYTAGSYVSIPLSTSIAYNYNNNEYLMILVRSVANGSTGDDNTSFYYKNPSNASNNTWYAKNDSSDPGQSADPSDFDSYGTGEYLPVIRFTYTGGTPTIALSPSSATITAGDTQTLTATVSNVSGTPTITYTSSNTSVATVSGSGTTATVTGVSAGTATITASMTVSGTTYRDTSTITVEAASYCTPTFSRTTDYIASFSLGSISNTSSGFSTGGYGNFTNLSTSLEQGASVTASLTSSDGSGTHAAAVWIDFDDSYTFETSERVGTKDGIGASATVDIDLTIPNDAAAGSHRMRVVYQYNVSATDINPCASANYGEAEDYTVIITALSNCEGFETDLGNWVVTYDNSNYQWARKAGTGHNYNTAGEGSYNVGAYYGDYLYQYTYLTLSTDLSSYIDKTISFQYINPNWGDDVDAIYLQYSTDGTNWIDLQSYTSGVTTWTQVTDLAIPNAAKYIRFAAYCNYGHGVGLDEICLDYTESSCPIPTNLTTSNITPSGATIGWSSEVGEYEMEYAIFGGAISTFDFEDGTLQGWTNLIVNTDGGQWLHSNNNPGGYDYTTTAHDGTGFALSYSFIDNDAAYNTNVYLVSPQQYLIGTGASLNFWYAFANSSYPDNMQVCVSTAATPTAASFVSIWSSTAVNSWSEVNIPLNDYDGQSIWIAFHHEDYDAYEIWVDDITINPGNSNFTWIPVNGTINDTQHTLTSLASETIYGAHVRAVCGTNDVSGWSDVVIFTTLSACSVPTNLSTTNIEAASATLNWTGYQNQYDVQYREVYFFEEFRDVLPSTWNTVDSDGDGYTWQSYFEDMVSSASYVNNVGALTPDNWLITPQVDLKGILSVWMYGQDQNAYAEHFAIYVSTAGNTVADFTATTPLLEGNTTHTLAEYNVNLSNYNGQKGYIAIRHYDCTDQYWLNIDKFGIYGTMKTGTASANTLAISSLEPSTDYEWQVKGAGCTDWSEVATFTTLEGYTKDITAYSGDGGWYLIASPVTANVTPAADNGFLTSNYDLYYFNQDGDSDGNEWINYEDTSDGDYDIVNGMGYLYASSTNTTLVFTGSAYSGNGQVNLTYSTSNADANMHGWNVVGNPFAQDAYINIPFYTLENGSEFTENAAGTVIHAMQGVLVHTEAATTLTFSTTAPSKGANLALNLSQGRSVIDRAIVSFSEGRQLPKFQLNPNHTKVYMPVDGKDYAVANAENEGEMPVSFKAETNGNYTLSFNAEEVSFAYLHLIDNMNGNDVDLLETPSYSFVAKTTDYESRFKLVFATGNNSNEDNFAFFSNGSFVINNEGNATLQVIDVNGRILKSESINGCANINVNAAPGVYMIRLINGDDVKVQKVVVR